ncbi:2611_t:CDS:2 [Funneliformis mosseae]|uniref:2611_t:CDS:1 n=1 Tax=Funneliformis mosseae TaxID=27381 RepID=A0A9N9GBJ0_FUNMO|nr:2611_t:CDS:2 [Funneliformis mosseae]
MKEELNIQDKDSEVLLNIQDKEFEELLTYDNAEDFSNANSTSDKVANTEADTEEDAKLFLDPVTSSLTHLFWMSPEQHILWLCYHDVIMHNNTCKTNHYNHLLSLFITPNNNLKTRIVTQAIVDDKSQLSYEWVFRCVKDATSISLKVFIMDGDLTIEGMVLTEFSSTYHIYYIWHISQNLPKRLKGELDSSFSNFMKDFFKSKNSLTKTQFNERWEMLLQNYSKAKDYLMRSLGNNPQSWAYAFTNQHFTARVQSTSHNEDKNSTLKWLFRSANLSLCELFDVMEKRYQEESDYCEPVVLQLKEFVMPNIMKNQEEQMNLSLYYHAMEVEPEVVFSKEKYKDTLQEFDISNNAFVSVSPFNVLILKISKTISKKRKFGELWGLRKKVMVDVIEDNNEDNYHEFLEVFLSLQKKITTKNYWPKGCPKSKRVKSSLKQPSVKTQYKCKLYKQRRHNSKTCKEQEQLNTNVNKENIDDESQEE